MKPIKVILLLMLSAVYSLSAMGMTSVGDAAVQGNPKPETVAVSLLETKTEPGFSYTLDSKRTVFDSGDCFLSYRVHSVKSAGCPEPFTFTLKGKNGTVTYYDRAVGQWRTVPLEAKLPDAVLFIQTDVAFLMLGPAVVYKPCGNGSLQDIGSHGAVYAYENGSGYRLDINLELSGGSEGHLWMLTSDKPGIEWNDEAKTLWQRIDLNGSHRLCYDGVYRQSPSDYLPAGSGMFFLNPAVHPAGVLNKDPGRVAAEMTVVMLNEALQHQNAEGYWPTLPESGWLSKDYGIGSGFYDTRFNNGVTMAFFSAYRRLGIQSYLEAGLKQADWLLRFAEDHHFIAGSGILVEDYGYAASAHKPAHCSLNHQLQEIKVLLTATDLTSDTKYFEMAERMLEGIRGSEDRWISAEKGLEYAILPDGSTGLQDYPYLTYNDLFEVQEMLEARDGRDPALDRLMASKLRQMLRAGIQGYLTYDTGDTPAAIAEVLNEFIHIQALPSDCRVMVDGRLMPFDAYLIRGENYFKLRDLAAAFSGTQKQFLVSWDGDMKKIAIMSGGAYTYLGGELSGTSGGGAVKALISTQGITLNGEDVHIEAYNIEGSNYFRLRDLGRLFGFDVEWDSAERAVLIKTTEK